jgi:MerR family transcriptional regulator, Zn(II)-responsive regulator of zntA
MRQMRDGFTIGDLAERSQVSRDTLRFYERRRLLSAPRRTASGYRLYREDDANRVRFIRRAQAMGLTLEDIQELLRAQTLETADQCRRVASRLRARIETVDEKIAELRAFRAELARGLRDCERAGATPSCCPVVLDLAANGARKGGKR